MLSLATWGTSSLVALPHYAWSAVWHHSVRGSTEAHPNREVGSEAVGHTAALEPS
jgi:hypothetical protein